MIRIQELRRATSKSLKEINNLLPQLSETAKPISLKALQAIVKNKDICLVVSKDGEEIIGMGTLVIMHTVVGVRARVEDVVVDSKQRSRGVGKKISRELIALAKKKKVRSIELSSRPSRTVANKLYRKLGFKKRDTNVYNLPLQ
ncbi:MAG: GNAT family N-acetyltransferase [Candidatus Colwellbacteria bacterium]|nr:GNAT family N-acetyltransferase [Candidatus Colwellbacteria bacterium]